MQLPIPDDRSIRFSQKDWVEITDKVFDTLCNYPSITYTYLSGEELTLTYGQIRELERISEQEFRERGFVPGDRVAFVSSPSPHYLFLAHTLSRIGLTCALIDNSLPIDEIEKLIDTADPCAVIASTKILAAFSDDFKKDRMLFELDRDGKLAELVQDSPEKVVTHTTDPDTDVMLILFSSGTTGKMKGAKLSYHSIIRGLEVDCKICDLANRPVGTTSFFYVLPINHIAGYMSVTGAFFCGTELKFLEEITPLRYLEGLKKYEPTHFLTVPAVYDVMEQKAFEAIRQKGKIVNWAIRSLLNFSGFMRERTGRAVGKRVFKKIYSQFLGNNIECVVTGASPCKDSTAKFFANMGLQWANYYASTETCIPVCAIWASDKDKCGYSGYANAIDFVQIRIGDTDAEGIGEIQVKSDIVMNGYFRDPEATAASFDGEWFRTGDRGYIDNENKLHIVGRIKESIVLRTGKKVAAHDVDEYYQNATDRAYNLACCGIPTEDGCEEIHIFIEKGDFSEQRQAEIKKEIMSLSATAASMYHISDVHFIETIPLTSVRKIKRFELRKMITDVPKTPVRIECNDTEEKSEDSLCSMIRKYKPDAEIASSSRLVEDIGLDSISLFNIKCDIESRYNMDFGGAFGEAKTVGDLWKMMNGELPDILADEEALDLSAYPSPRNAATGKELRKWARRLSRPYRFEVSGLENIPQDGSNYIVCANHASYLDPIWIVDAADGRIDYSRVAGMAAKERMDNRIEHKMFDVFGSIPVDRFGNPLPATQRAKECLTNEKYIMFIFPEGARSRDGSMLPFKAGAAELSIQTGTKIVPVRLEGSFEIFPRHKKYPKLFSIPRKKIRVVFGEPMDPADYDDPNVMTQRMKEIISGLL